MGRQLVRIIKEYQNTSLIDEVAKSLQVLEKVNREHHSNS